MYLRAVQLGANNYSGNSSVKMRVTSADATHFDVEILNSFGYNNAEYLSVGCKAIKCDNECSITTYTSYTAGSGTVEKEITSSYNSIVANLTGNASTASKWQTARTLSLTGAVTGSASIDGSGNVSINTTYATGNISSLDSRYVNVSGDTMTGLLSFSDGSHKGLKVGSCYITAISDAFRVLDGVFICGRRVISQGKLRSVACRRVCFVLFVLTTYYASAEDIGQVGLLVAVKA